MNSPLLRAHLDDRGLSRALLEMWIPHLAVDTVWLVDVQPPLDVRTRTELLPVVPLSAVDLAAVAAEPRGESARVLVAFGSVEALRIAAGLGFGPTRLTINHHRPGADSRRVAPEVELDAPALDGLVELEELGFSFEIQPNPHVTPRPWSPCSEREANR